MFPGSIPGFISNSFVSFLVADESCSQTALCQCYASSGVVALLISSVAVCLGVVHLSRTELAGRKAPGSRGR